ncbi:hypothetical protein BDQ17DRAFT_1334185 [Cyathus striatus]|nr:hypothetical protein BDQ17DRAFT_1334185 [Cyathus striatus]
MLIKTYKSYLFNLDKGESIEAPSETDTALPHFDAFCTKLINLLCRDGKSSWENDRLIILTNSTRADHLPPNLLTPTELTTLGLKAEDLVPIELEEGELMERSEDHLYIFDKLLRMTHEVVQCTRVAGGANFTKIVIQNISKNEYIRGNCFIKSGKTGGKYHSSLGSAIFKRIFWIQGK